MGLFGFGKKYSRQDMQNEINLMGKTFRQVAGIEPSNKSKYQLKQELTSQLDKVLTIARKNSYYGGEVFEWNGIYTPLRDITPVVQVLLECI